MDRRRFHRRHEDGGSLQAGAPNRAAADLYRLISPENGSERSATFYVSPDKHQAVLFAFLHSSTKLDVLPRIQMLGLNSAPRYRMRPIDGAPAASDPVQSGAYWMSVGVDLPLKGDFQAEGRMFEAVD
jgi:alpha-galactosidase